MAKISRISSIKLADVMKQKKMEQKRIAKEKAEAIRAAQELEFDKFVRNTAKDMLKGIGKFRLQVFNGDVSL